MLDICSTTLEDRVGKSEEELDSVGVSSVGIGTTVWLEIDTGTSLTVGSTSERREDSETIAVLLETISEICKDETCPEVVLISEAELSTWLTSDRVEVEMGGDWVSSEDTGVGVGVCTGVVWDGVSVCVSVGVGVGVCSGVENSSLVEVPAVVETELSEEMENGGTSGVVEDVETSSAVEDVTVSIIVDDVRVSIIVEVVRTSTVVEDVRESTVVEDVGVSIIVEDVRVSIIVENVGMSDVVTGISTPDVENAVEMVTTELVSEVVAIELVAEKRLEDGDSNTVLTTAEESLDEDWSVETKEGVDGVVGLGVVKELDGVMALEVGVSTSEVVTSAEDVEVLLSESVDSGS
jgi:hypothetical protein